MRACRQLYSESQSIIHDYAVFVFREPRFLSACSTTGLTVAQNRMLQGKRYVRFQLSCDILEPADEEYTTPRTPESFLYALLLLIKDWQAVHRSAVEGTARLIKYEIDFEDVPFKLLYYAGWLRFRTVILGLLLAIARYDVGMGAESITYTNIPNTLKKVSDRFQQTGRVVLPRNWGDHDTITKEMSACEKYWYCMMRKAGILTQDSQARWPFHGKYGEALPRNRNLRRAVVNNYAESLAGVEGIAEYDSHIACLTILAEHVENFESTLWLWRDVFGYDSASDPGNSDIGTDDSSEVDPSDTEDERRHEALEQSA